MHAGLPSHLLWQETEPEQQLGFELRSCEGCGRTIRVRYDEEAKMHTIIDVLPHSLGHPRSDTLAGLPDEVLRDARIRGNR
jgi:hypothetical protein